MEKADACACKVSPSIIRVVKVNVGIARRNGKIVAILPSYDAPHKLRPEHNEHLISTVPKFESDGIIGSAHVSRDREQHATASRGR